MQAVSMGSFTAWKRATCWAQWAGASAQNAFSATTMPRQRRQCRNEKRRIIISEMAPVHSSPSDHHAPMSLPGCCKGHHPHTLPSKNPLQKMAVDAVTALSPLLDLHHSNTGVVAACLAFMLYLIPSTIVPSWIPIPAMAMVICLSGVPVFSNALLSMCQLTIDASVLMSLSVIGSMYLGITKQGLLLLILLHVSHVLEAKFTHRFETSLQALHDSLPDKASVVSVDPKTKEPIMSSVRVYKAMDVPVGTCIMIRPGEQVPLDGAVVSGMAYVTVEHVTGESLPHTVKPGNHVAAGSHNIDGLLVLETIATASDSTPTRIARLAMEAQKEKPAVQRWLDRLTAVWSKCALLAACGVAAGCVMAGVPFYGSRGALYRALCFVTAAAPCALILTPLAYICALCNASRRNILIKSAVALDTLQGCSYIALDKTGTLTDGKLVCTNIVTAEDIVQCPTETKRRDTIVGTPLKQRALCYAVDLSKRSTHPVATAVVEAGRQHLSPEGGNCDVSNFEMVPGSGVRGTIVSTVHNKQILADFGSVEFVQEYLSHASEDQKLEKAMHSVTDLYGKSVSVLTTRDSDGNNLEWSAFCFRDQLQSMSKLAVQSLQQGRWKTGKPRRNLQKQVAILTGDNDVSAHAVGALLEIDDVYSKHKPEDKHKFIQAMQSALKTKQRTQTGLVMVGDGINDAPAMVQADVGISISETASDISATASDIIILNGQAVANLPYLFQLSDQLRNVVIQNLVLAFSAMLIVCLPALKGWIPLWCGVLCHEGSTILTAVNSCRLLLFEPRKLGK